MSKGFDAEQYKTGQQKSWDAASSKIRTWESIFERAGGQALSERMLDSVGVKSGERVLDVATGYGEPALTAAQRVGPTGSVVGTDISEGMLAIARERADEMGLANSIFLQSDAEMLDFPEASFDLALCRLGLFLLPDLNVALQRIRRLLRPGGRFGALIHGEPAKAPGVSVIQGAVQRVLQPPPPPPGAPSIFGLSAPGKLEAALEDAGFVNVSSERFMATWTYESPEQYARFLFELGGPLQTMLAAATPEKRQQVWDGVLQDYQAFTDVEGRLVLHHEIVSAVGKRTQRPN